MNLIQGHWAVWLAVAVALVVLAGLAGWALVWVLALSD